MQQNQHCEQLHQKECICMQRTFWLVVCSWGLRLGELQTSYPSSAVHYSSLL